MRPLFLRMLCVLCVASTPLCFADEVEEEQIVVVEDQDVGEGLIAAVDNLGPTAGGFSSEGNFGQQDDELNDPKVLRNFVENYGLIQARKQDGNLIIAGDVRARWMVTDEKSTTREGEFLKVRGSGTDTARNLFKAEANLILDYTAPRSWVAVKVRWSDFMGTDGGSSTRVDLDRAFLGYDLYTCEDENLYIEAGRTRLDYLFDSNVEFGSIFDGVHLSYSNYFDPIGQCFIHGGPFIIDSYTNHYAWALETGIIAVGDTGFGVKYSIVDWRKHGVTLNYGNESDSGEILILDNPRYRFMVSQLLLEYGTDCTWLWGKSIYFYGAALINTAAKPTRTTNWKKANSAWYVGCTFGDLVQAGDWSLDVNYQYVQAQAVPEFDLSGVGHGNALNLLLSDAIIQGLDAYGGQGFTNYKGIQISYFYALTDSLSLKAKFECTTPIDKSIGGNFWYRNYEVAGIYAF